MSRKKSPAELIGYMTDVSDLPGISEDARNAELADRRRDVMRFAANMATDRYTDPETPQGDINNWGGLLLKVNMYGGSPELQKLHESPFLQPDYLEELGGHLACIGVRVPTHEEILDTFANKSMATLERAHEFSSKLPDNTSLMLIPNLCADEWLTVFLNKKLRKGKEFELVLSPTAQRMLDDGANVADTWCLRHDATLHEGDPYGLDRYLLKWLMQSGDVYSETEFPIPVLLEAVAEPRTYVYGCTRDVSEQANDPGYFMITITDKSPVDF